MTTAHTTSEPDPNIEHLRRSLLDLQAAIATALDAVEALPDPRGSDDALIGMGALTAQLKPMANDPRVANDFRLRLAVLATKLYAKHPLTPVTARVIGQFIRYWPEMSVEAVTPNGDGTWKTSRRPWNKHEQRSWAIQKLMADGYLTKTTGKDKAGRVQTYYIPQPPPALTTPDKAW